MQIQNTRDPHLTLITHLTLKTAEQRYKNKCKYK